jgi:hypothetical protein
MLQTAKDLVLGYFERAVSALECTDEELSSGYSTRRPKLGITQIEGWSVSYTNLLDYLLVYISPL